MPRITRTLKNGGDTGKLNRDEVRAVTLALSEGRTEDVLSGRVLAELRAAKNGATRTGTEKKGSQRRSRAFAA